MPHPLHFPILILLGSLVRLTKAAFWASITCLHPGAPRSPRQARPARPPHPAPPSPARPACPAMPHPLRPAPLRPPRLAYPPVHAPLAPPRPTTRPHRLPRSIHTCSARPAPPCTNRPPRHGPPRSTCIACAAPSTPPAPPRPTPTAPPASLRPSRPPRPASPSPRSTPAPPAPLRPASLASLRPLRPPDPTQVVQVSPQHDGAGATAGGRGQPAHHVRAGDLLPLPADADRQRSVVSESAGTIRVGRGRSRSLPSRAAVPAACMTGSAAAPRSAAFSNRAVVSGCSRCGVSQNPAAAQSPPSGPAAAAPPPRRPCRASPPR